MWREESRALILHGTPAIEESVVFDFGVIPGRCILLNVRNGKWYSRHGSLSGLINVIPLAVEKLATGSLPPFTSPSRPLILGLFSLLLSVAVAALLFSVTGFYVESLPVRAAFVLLSIYTTYLWNYLRGCGSETYQLLAYLFFYISFLRFKRRPEPFAERPRADLYWAWLALAALCQIRFTYLALGPLLAAAIAYDAWRAGVAREHRDDLLARLIVVPGVLVLLAQGAVHFWKFGSPFLSGYHQWWEPPVPHTVWTVLYDFLVSAQYGFFICFPLLVLALFGWRRFFSNHRDEAALLLASALAILCILAPLPFWRGGWAYGPRYFVFILPLLALPALYPLEWAFVKLREPRRAAALFTVVVFGLFSAFAQLQIHRLPYFTKYVIYESLGTVRSPAVSAYFETTALPKINWDHLHKRWEELPYFAELKGEIPPERLAKWQKRTEALLATSNLFFFPKINVLGKKE